MAGVGNTFTSCSTPTAVRARWSRCVALRPIGERSVPLKLPTNGAGLGPRLLGSRHGSHSTRSTRDRDRRCGQVPSLASQSAWCRWS